MEVDRIGVRRLLALVKGLPPDSAVSRDGKAWGRADEMAALAIERADRWSSIHAMQWGAKANDLPDLITFSHPDREDGQQAKRAQRTSDPEAIRRFFRGG